jgi:hypothetical protein
LKPGGRVAKELNMPNGVPAEYLEKEWSKGDEAFFNMMYGGLNTNSKPGDGYKYRGRGLIAMTGRSVYRDVGKIIGVDLEANPDAITQDMDIASKAAVGYLAMVLGGKQGGPKKGFEIMNSFTDANMALKTVLRAVAGLGHKESEFDTEGSHLHEQYRKASTFLDLGSAAANNTGTQLASASSENKDLKSQSGGGTTIVNNNTSIVAQGGKQETLMTNKVNDKPIMFQG